MTLLRRNVGPTSNRDSSVASAPHSPPSSAKSKAKAMLHSAGSKVSSGLRTAVKPIQKKYAEHQRKKAENRDEEVNTYVPFGGAYDGQYHDAPDW